MLSVYLIFLASVLSSLAAEIGVGCSSQEILSDIISNQIPAEREGLREAHLSILDEHFGGIDIYCVNSYLVEVAMSILDDWKVHPVAAGLCYCIIKDDMKSFQALLELVNERSVEGEHLLKLCRIAERCCRKKMLLDLLAQPVSGLELHQDDKRKFTLLCGADYTCLQLARDDPKACLALESISDEQLDRILGMYKGLGMFREIMEILQKAGSRFPASEGTSQYAQLCKLYQSAHAALLCLCKEEHLCRDVIRIIINLMLITSKK